jgi:hypothetical protein
VRKGRGRLVRSGYGKPGTATVSHTAGHKRMDKPLDKPRWEPHSGRPPRVWGILSGMAPRKVRSTAGDGTGDGAG